MRISERRAANDAIADWSSWSSTDFNEFDRAACLPYCRINLSDLAFPIICSLSALSCKTQIPFFGLWVCTYGSVHTVGFPISWFFWSCLSLFTVLLVGSLVPKTSQLYGPDRKHVSKLWFQIRLFDIFKTGPYDGVKFFLSGPEADNSLKQVQYDECNIYVRGTDFRVTSIRQKNVNVFWGRFSRNIDGWCII